MDTEYAKKIARDVETAIRAWDQLMSFGYESDTKLLDMFIYIKHKYDIGSISEFMYHMYKKGQFTGYLTDTLCSVDDDYRFGATNICGILAEADEGGRSR